MIIPRTATEDGKPDVEGQRACEVFLDDIINTCESSSIDRMSINESLRNYCLFGTGNEDKVNYNKIYPTVDLLTSFLYGQESVQFSIKYGEGVPKEQSRYMEKLRMLAHQLWHETGTDQLFGDAIFWALTYNTFFIKCIWSDCLRTYPLEPHLIGVYREDIPSIDDQEAITQQYYMSRSALESMLRKSKHSQIQAIMERVSNSGPVDESMVPKTVSQIILSQTQPNLVGAANVSRLEYKYRPRISPDLIQMREVWVWDDDLDDYRCFTLANPNIMIYNDPGAKLHIKGEHPFIKVTPLTIYNYFWGQSMVQSLMGLQDWRDKHMSRIDTIFRRKLRPSRIFTGPWAGITDERMVALDREGGYFNSVQPTAKVDTYTPDIDMNTCWQYIHEIDDMFNEMAGLANILRAEGDEGVRSMQHAQVLARMGSSRVKKKALVLENPAEALATMMMKLNRLHDKTKYLDENGKEFLLSQVDADFIVKVSGHSLSPVFIEDAKFIIQNMLANRIIDRKTYIELSQPPMAEMLEKRLEKIEEADAKAAQLQTGMETLKIASKFKK